MPIFTFKGSSNLECYLLILFNTGLLLLPVSSAKKQYIMRILLKVLLLSALKDNSNHLHIAFPIMFYVIFSQVVLKTSSSKICCLYQLLSYVLVTAAIVHTTA